MADVEEKFHISRILLAVDGSENSARAARAATQLAKDYDADLIVLNVISPIISVPTVAGADSVPIDYGSYYNEAKENGLELVNRITVTAANEGVRIKNLVERSEGTIPETIVAIALNENADLIVMGTRGLGGLKKVFLGSVSGGVLSHSHCNVLVVR